MLVVHRFDIVVIRTSYKSHIVPALILRAQTRRAVISAPSFKRCVIEGINLLATRSPEGQM
ncbi:hypothetical protein H8L32_08630 [Undibacterium sp. CY18W]|uniref:Uncharacterized protein n=1 Tax=Undibacterium hunanense TaxID=2762292 RepID=A0ABR6ZNU4_9BURK|nr:hypothetical protein [Undibacterium hunanense]